MYLCNILDCAGPGEITNCCYFFKTFRISLSPSPKKIVNNIDTPGRNKVEICFEKNRFCCRRRRWYVPTYLKRNSSAMQRNTICVLCVCHRC